MLDFNTSKLREVISMHVNQQETGIKDVKDPDHANFTLEIGEIGTTQQWEGNDHTAYYKVDTDTLWVTRILDEMELGGAYIRLIDGNWKYFNVPNK